MTTQSQSYPGNEVGDAIPGAARLISETAQTVHAIRQKQKNGQHLQRVQALLGGRHTKWLTSGSLHTSLFLPFFFHVASTYPFPQPPFHSVPMVHSPRAVPE